MDAKPPAKRTKHPVKAARITFLATPKFKKASSVGIQMDVPRVAFQATKKPVNKSKFALTGALPHISVSIGDEDHLDGVVKLKGCLDSCAGGTIGYQPYHEHLYKSYPELFYEFIDYKRAGMQWNFIGGIEEDGDGIEITAEISYKTPYIIEGCPVKIVVGLSDDIAANTIFGVPLQNNVRFVINYVEVAVTSSKFRETFIISYQALERIENKVIPLAGLQSKTMITNKQE